MGKGYVILPCKDKKIAVINLIGRVTMGILSENPFLTAKQIINQIKSQVCAAQKPLSLTPSIL